MKSTLNVLLIAGLAAAIPTPGADHVLHEKRNGDPITWKKDSRAAYHHVLPLRIGLKQQNLHNIDEYLNDIGEDNERIDCV